MQHEHPVLIGVLAPFAAATTFITCALERIAASGLTWATAAALLAGVGSCLIGFAGVSREIRGWYFGVKPKLPTEV